MSPEADQALFAIYLKAQEELRAGNLDLGLLLQSSALTVREEIRLIEAQLARCQWDRSQKPAN